MAKLRIKSDWFQTGTAKTPAQMASAMAFIAWRVAQNMLKQMRLAQFDIEIGEQYFAFTREVLVFLTQVLDRMAYQRMSAQERLAFVTALVKREAVQKYESQAVIEKAFDDSLPKFIASFLSDRKLSQQEVVLK